MNPLVDLYAFMAPLIGFLANVFSAIVFWLLYDAKRHEMTEGHRLAYCLFTAGLAINAVMLLADRKDVPGLGELMAYLGFALLAYVAAAKNRDCLSQYKKLGLWF